MRIKSAALTLIPMNILIIKNCYQLVAAVLVCTLLMRCGRAQVVHVGKEKNALDALKTSFNHPFLNRNWTGVPCFSSTWYGVKCARFNNTDRVTRITLPSMQLNGSIDLNAFAEFNELSVLALNNNSLWGNMMDFTRNPKLTHIDISGNALYGQLSGSVLSLGMLETLLLQDNGFKGQIPELNQSTTLKAFNVSNNNLNGSIPMTRALQTFGYNSYSGNPGLCGPPSPTACYYPLVVRRTGNNEPDDGKKTVPDDNNNNKNSNFNLYMFLLDAAGLVAVILLFVLYYRKSRKLKKAMKEFGKTKSSSSSIVNNNLEERKDVAVRDDHKKKTEQEGIVIIRDQMTRSSDGAAAARPHEHNNSNKRGKLVFVSPSGAAAPADAPVFEMADLLKASAEGLGKGIFGNSYKAEIITNNSTGRQIKQAVVVKRLMDLKPLVSEEFTKQLQVIANLKHPNLLPLLAYYLSKEEKLLLYKYVRNGNLFYRMFGERGPDRIPFGWSSRLAVARGVARALEYLHASSSSSTAPHGNLKSSNVLLDEKDGVLVSDYGFASLVALPIAAQRMVSYKSPEYHKTKKVSKESDVWSYGSLCLELLTGKISACTAPLDVNGVDLCNWVHRAVREEWTAEIFDMEISSRKRASTGMLRLLQIAMRCCDPLPEKRPEMWEVVREVENIRVAELEADDDEDSLTDDSTTAPPPTRFC